MTEAEEEEPPPSSTGLDWEKLFKMAEDPDLEESLLNPLEKAQKQISDPKEVQKLQAIRSLPSLLESHGEECIEKFLPSIQQCLKDEKSNLDIHCEAAVVYKSVLQNDDLTQKFPALIQMLLEHILGNVSAQKENLSAAAWLETLVEVAERVSIDAVKQYIVPVVQQQADPVQRVQRRVIATKLLHKLADILPASEVRKELGPCAQQLCQDANSNVRTAMAQRLPTIARALKNASDCVALLLPCFVQLCKDDDSCVREACLNNLADCLPHFTKEAKKNTIVPLIRKTVELCLEKRDDTLPVVARHLGLWSFTLWEELDRLDRSWVLNTYLKMVAETKAEVTGAAAQSNLKITRKMTAYNMPCMVELFPKSFERLAPIFQSFCEDHDDDVRLAVAASFHELLARQPERPLLLECFIDLIRGGAPEVVSRLTHNLDKILPTLYKLASTENGKVGRLQLDRMLLGCNQLLRGTGSWRAHEALLRHIVVLRRVLPVAHIHDTFVPLLQKEALQVRALPCRIAAVNTLLTIMREQPNAEKRKEVIDFLKIEIAGHKSCYRRALFLDAAECAIRVFSRRFFVEHFLPDVVRLTLDEVSNIRLKATRLMSVIKSFLLLPDDDDTLLQLEKAVRESLTKEKQPNTRQLLQNYACELSRSETKMKGDKEDKRREEEEKKLWTAVEEEPEATTSKGATRENFCLRPPPEPVRATSPWRSQRRIVAIVRPQPVVVMRAASPAPPANRPSRLPLSVAARDKEISLKKAAKESSLPRIPSRTSSVGPRSSMSTSTSSLESGKNSPPATATSFGLRRSATTTTGFGGSMSSSTSSYALMSSRSSSSIRRPSYGLSRVSSHSTLEKKPSHVKVRGIDG